jgi:hypothetical protein
VCADELPPATEYLPWLCPECLVATDPDATRPRSPDFTSVFEPDLSVVPSPIEGEISSDLPRS